MPVQLENETCPSCNRLHTFFLANDWTAQQNREYQFRCPNTKKIDRVRPKMAGTTVDKCPDGAIEIEPIS